MIDFQIQRGPSELILSDRLIIENGCWYLCEDTAELYLGIKDKATGELTLKQINGDHDKESIDPAVLELLNTEINKVKESLSDYAKKTDLPNVEGFATKEFVQEELNKINIPDVSNFITEAEVEAKGYLTEQDIDAKADADHTHTLADITDYVAPDFTGYATQEFVSKKIAEAELKDKEADLEAYYTKSEVDALIPDITGFIKEIPSEYITEEELNAKGYLTEHQDLSNYALKSEIPTDYLKEIPAEYITASELTEALEKIEHPTVDLAGYATEKFVEDAIAEIEIPDVSNFITMGDVEAKGYITEIPSEYITESELNAKGFITDISGKAEAEHKHTLSDITDYSAPDLSEYAKRSELPDVSGFIKEIPVEYITETELEAKGYLTAHQDLSEYAKKSDIPTDYLKAIPDEYITETELAAEIAKIEHPANPTKVSELENDANYATEQYVIDAIETHEGIAKKEEVEEVKTKLENEVLPTIQETILPVVEKAATQEWVNEQGFLKEHQSLEDYAKKADIPSVEGLATEDFVRSEIENIDIPTVDTSNLVTTEILNNVLATKADKILFTTPKFVKKPIGDFIENEPVNGCTLAELFAKLLGLSDTLDDEPDEPEIPDTPDVPQDVTIEIVKQQSIPAMQGSVGKSDGSTKIEDSNSVYNYLEILEENKSAAPQEAEPGTSILYEIKNTDGDVVEHGYQIYTIASGRGTLWRVSLAEGLTIKDVRMYDDLTSSWVAYTPTFTDTGERLESDGYTYVVYQSSDRSNNEILRFILE